ncbi:MAG: nitroreductase [Bacteroidales bacterium]|jgi:nitroreductase|nr:nitroreductase [Bacteroidales bacterium]
MKHIRAILLGSVIVLCTSCGTEPQSKNPAGETSNPVTENIMSRRSIRKYKPVPISRDQMEAILESGIHAPNGQGWQSWEVRIVDNQEFLNGLSAVYHRKNSQGGGNGRNLFYGAPVVAFIAYDTTYDLSQVDCGLFGENMILSAWSVGIGSCCLGGPARFITGDPDAAEYLKKLDFPDTHRLLYCIAFGIPDEAPAAKPRKRTNVRYID